MKTGLALLLRRPAYRRLWSSELVSLVGDWFSLVAVSVVSLGAPGGGLFALATSLAAHLVPQALTAPFGGWLADRLDKRTVLVGGALVEGSLTIAMVVAAVSGNVLALQAFLALRSIASSAREPASGAALPRVVAKDELADANALGAMTWSVTFAIGMSLGGFATAVGPALALAVDAATFFVAAVIVAGIPSIPPSKEDLGRPGKRASPEVLAFATSRKMRGAIFGLTPLAFVSGAAWLQLNVVAHAIPFAAGAATTVGILQAIRGAGTAVGPLVTRPDARGRSASSLPSAIAVVAGTLGLAWAPSSAIVAIASFVWGIGAGGLWMIMTLEIQTRSPDAVRGRMIGLSGLGFTLAMSLGAIAAAILAERGASPLSMTLGMSALGLAGHAWVRRYEHGSSFVGTLARDDHA